MVKILLNFTFIFLMLASFSFAKNVDAPLQDKYGKDLKHAQFFLRFAFSKQYDKSWAESSYEERRGFLKKYEDGVAAAEAKDKEEAKALKEKEKERYQEERNLKRKLADREKEQEAEDKAEQKEAEDRQKEFKSVVDGQQQQLQQMQDQLKEQQLSH